MNKNTLIGVLLMVFTIPLLWIVFYLGYVIDVSILDSEGHWYDFPFCLTSVVLLVGVLGGGAFIHSEKPLK